MTDVLRVVKGDRADLATVVCKASTVECIIVTIQNDFTGEFRVVIKPLASNLPANFTRTKHSHKKRTFLMTMDKATRANHFSRAIWNSFPAEFWKKVTTLVSTQCYTHAVLSL